MFIVNDTATTEIYTYLNTLSLHDALPISPDFVNVAFWVHDIRRKRTIRDRSKFRQAFNQEMSDAYFEALSSQKIMQHELYLTMIYCTAVSGKRFVEKSADNGLDPSPHAQAVAKLQEQDSHLAGGPGWTDATQQVDVRGSNGAH